MSSNCWKEPGRNILRFSDTVLVCSFFGNNNYRMLCFVKKAFVLACLTTVHEFYGLKASQMSKVRASSREYPDVEGIKNLCEQNFKGHSTKQLRQLISKLNACVKYPDWFNCFRCLYCCCKTDGPYLNTKPESLFVESLFFGVYLWSFGVGVLSMWSYAPNIFNCAPKTSAVHLKIYIWSHKCSQSQK